VSFDEAKGIIDALAKNHWRPVDGPKAAARSGAEIEVF
jgi:hypothetical protein